MYPSLSHNNSTGAAASSNDGKQATSGTRGPNENTSINYLLQNQHQKISNGGHGVGQRDSNRTTTTNGPDNGQTSNGPQ